MTPQRSQDARRKRSAGRTLQKLGKTMPPPQLSGAVLDDKRPVPVLDPGAELLRYARRAHREFRRSISALADLTDRLEPREAIEIYDTIIQQCQLRIEALRQGRGRRRS